MELHDIASNPGAIKSYIEAARSMFRLVKDFISALPDSENKNAAIKAIERAEIAAKLAESQIAQQLGYRLCKCEFPPNPMLFKGEYDEDGVQIYKCLVCGNDTRSKANPIGSLDWV